VTTGKPTESVLPHDDNINCERKSNVIASHAKSSWLLMFPNTIGIRSKAPRRGFVLLADIDLSDSGHCQTFPIMSWRPHGFAGNSQTDACLGNWARSRNLKFSVGCEAKIHSQVTHPSKTWYSVVHKERQLVPARTAYPDSIVAGSLMSWDWAISKRIVPKDFHNRVIGLSVCGVR
jgi:hypothetical protein